MDERPHRYKNRGKNGDCIFATTTCLDFVHAFAPEACRDLMTLSLLDDARRYGMALRAFVVMPHHIHFVGFVPRETTASWLLNRIKSNSARRVLRILPPEIKAQFCEQEGLNRRSFWKDGFRSTVCFSPKVRTQKIDYTHNNPVLAGYCLQAADYAWSSARFWAEGFGDLDLGLDLEAAMQPFMHMYRYLDLGSFEE